MGQTGQKTVSEDATKQSKVLLGQQSHFNATDKQKKIASVSHKTIIVNVCGKETRAFSSKGRWLDIWILVPRMKEVLESEKSQVRSEGYTECNYGQFVLL